MLFNRNFFSEKSVVSHQNQLYLYYLEMICLDDQNPAVRTSFHAYEKMEPQQSIKSNYENVSGKYANVPDQENNPYLIPDVNPYVDPDTLPE